ncbi:hypothetical protein Salat_2753700 [Sesamum alatum]|uniref:LysM domain-containing protein n=1 Tax=Sesamum alatum TaxID=300844 RepID=A0AAE1XKB4_9LAMI|nr:hypothetical protein Salat_2753700 [Sesamum alatum]
MELKLAQSSLPTAIFSSSSFFTKHFTLLAQRWKLHIQRISWKDQDINKKILVHVVKDGENLTSISKLYGVPIHDIAAVNKDIVDVDLVSEGQHLNIPSASAGYAQGSHFEGDKFHEHPLPKATPCLEFNTRQWNQILTIPSSCRLPLAKTTGSFLVLVPLIAFCIRCIIGACQNRVTRNLRRQAVNKSGVHRDRCNSMRWKTVLSELRDPDALDAESEMDSDPFSEEQEQVHFEESFHSYAKLEDDYQKFLSECGMSNWGYWRGGSPQ